MAVAIIVNMIHIFNYLLERLQYQAFLLNSSACSRRSEATTSATVNSKASSQETGNSSVSSPAPQSATVNRKALPKTQQQLH